MTKVYRMQEIGISFEDMLDFNSSNWTTGEELVGLAAAAYTDDLKDLAKHWYHGRYEGQEVVIFDGMITDDIGDGVLVSPIHELSRMPLSEFMGTEFDD